MKQTTVAVFGAVLLMGVMGGAAHHVAAQSSPVMPPVFTDPPVYANIIGINPIPIFTSEQHPPKTVPDAELAAPTAIRDDSDAGLAREGRR